jgi:DNA-binding beta-propeller fold protein YncE
MIERNFAQERNLSTSHTVDFLQREFIEKGKLGLKSDTGGFYPPTSIVPNNSGPRIIVLDNGLSGQVETLERGKVLEYTSTGQYVRTIFDEQYLPDGIVVLKEKQQMFWTCMGYPGQNDGMIYSANLDGSDMRSLIDKGRINTPKQIALDSANEKLYFADREGLCIWRCGLDGSSLEKIITTTSSSHDNDHRDATNWCVGITLSPSLGKIFWTQKGGPKGWQGRIFSANTDIPPGETFDTRSDKVCLLEGLAEPIDLEFHEESRSLYWTDRGEMPFGNTLNRLQFANNGQVLEIDNTPLLKYQILARKFHEAIGLKIDEENQHVYVADLGGSICRCNLDGSEKTRLLFEEGRAFTGIGLV